MTLAQLLHSLSDAERDFIASLDYGSDRAKHGAALDTVIQHDGEVDFDAQGFWYPYEVIELGKNWLQEGHEREYAACMGIVLLNIEAGRDLSNDLEYIVEQHYDSIRSLPADLRQLIDLLIDRNIKKSEPGAAGNSRPAGQSSGL
jgi:hypothetical protein